MKPHPLESFGFIRIEKNSLVSKKVTKRQLEDAVVRAAMRYFRQYGNWYYENGRKANTGTKLCEVCARLAARRRKRG